MFGAIVGDVLGSALEFEERKYENISDINLYNEKNHFTDDTVLTLAVADWLLNDIDKYYSDDEKLKEALGKRFVKWTKKYRIKELGYGASYMQWFFRAELVNEYNPYQSFGNGSAMRVSPVGWYFDTLEETLRFAKISADVTHNHPEGQKGALCIAAAIFLARNKYSKSQIREYLIRAFGYKELMIPLKDLRDAHVNECTCQNTVPQSVVCFLEGNDFESAVRLAISFGGDTDTMAAMTGSIAEAYYSGIPKHLTSYTQERLDEASLGMCALFYGRIKKKEQ
jgi:ADP-ribosylglycohydrolase